MILCCKKLYNSFGTSSQSSIRLTEKCIVIECVRSLYLLMCHSVSLISNNMHFMPSSSPFPNSLLTNSDFVWMCTCAGVF